MYIYVHVVSNEHVKKQVGKQRSAQHRKAHIVKIRLKRGEGWILKKDFKKCTLREMVKTWSNIRARAWYCTTHGRLKNTHTK